MFILCRARKILTKCAYFSNIYYHTSSYDHVWSGAVVALTKTSSWIRHIVITAGLQWHDIHM